MSLVPMLAVVIHEARKRGLGDYETAKAVMLALSETTLNFQPVTGKQHPESSHKAADKTRPTTKNQAGRILSFIVDHGDFGATDFEIVAMGLCTVNGVHARRGSLHKLALIKKAAFQRQSTESSVMVDVWVATGFGRHMDKRLREERDVGRAD